MVLQEKILVCELQRGNSKAFEALYLRYHSRLYNYANRILKNKQEAEGLVQEVFISIWENHEKLDVSKSFSGFIFRIARNKVLNIIKQNLTHQVYTKYVSENDKVRDDLRKEIEYREFIDLLRKSIDALPEKTKSIFLLSRNDGLTYKEIAEKTEFSVNIIDHEIRKALLEIRQFLDKYYVSE